MPVNFIRKIMKKVFLDKIKHTYTDETGKVYPSVTQLLKAANFYNYQAVNSDVLRRAAQFGQAVHKATALLDRDNLGEYDPALDPYLNGWRKFRSDFFSSLQIRIIERPLISTKYGFAGQPDRCFDNLTKSGGVVVDIKTGQHEDWHSLQTAGYDFLIREYLGKESPRTFEHWVVHLMPEEYKIEPVDKNDIEFNKKTFLSAVQIWHWRNSNGGNNHERNN